MTPLTTDVIEVRLTEHPDWRVDGHRLARDIQFPDFGAAWRFMNHVADLAEREDHHPNWYNVYGTVQIRLSTHDAKGITDRDLRLVAGIDQYLATSEYTNLPPTPFEG